MWTDELLSERFDAIDKRFDRIERDIWELRTDIRDLRQLMFQLWGTTMAGILGTLATVIVTNV
jgi:hypothetical protein